MKIYLVRHGQSCWQVDQESNDWNSALTALGHQQAQHLGRWLAAGAPLDHQSCLKIDYLYASPLIRAQQTADYLAQTLQLPVITNDHLREASFLVSEHLPVLTSPHHAPPHYQSSDMYTTFKKQATQALQALTDQVQTPDDTILAVAHGGLISTILRLVTHSDAVSFWVYNASLNLIEWKRGRWHLVFLNFWDHLPPELRTF